MFERFTDRARTIVVNAQQEARDLGHAFIGSEHLLLGMFESRDYPGRGQGVAEQVLTASGITYEAVHAAVVANYGDKPKATIMNGVPIPFSPRAKKILEFGLREALQLGTNYIGTEHLLLALLRQSEQDSDGTATKIIVGLGGNNAALRQTTIEFLQGAPPRSGPTTAANDLSSELVMLMIVDGLPVELSEDDANYLLHFVRNRRMLCLPFRLRDLATMHTARHDQ